VCQVLTRAPAGISAAFLVSPEESGRLQAQIQQIMGAHQKALEQQKPIVVRH
jgi:hypothetical protein